MSTAIANGDSTDHRLARVLGAILLMEVVVYGVLLYLGRADLLRTFLLCVGIAIVWRIVAFLGSFPIAWWAGDRRGSAGMWLRSVSTELMAMARAYCWDQLGVGGARENGGTSGRPVLLVHGFFCNAGIFNPLLAALRPRPARAINLDPFYWSISAGAQRLKAEIEAFSAANGGQAIFLMAHSMGGVYARYLLAREENLPVHGLITLGSPHAGTSLALMMPGGSELGPVTRRTRWLAESNLRKTAEACRLLAVVSWQDNIIVPQSSAFVPDAPELEFSGVGHVALLYDSGVRAHLLQTLDQWDSIKP